MNRFGHSGIAARVLLSCGAVVAVTMALGLLAMNRAPQGADPTLIVVMMIVATLVAVTAGLGTAASIVAPIGAATAALRRMAAGDLSGTIDSSRSGELGALLAGVSELQLALSAQKRAEEARADDMKRLRAQLERASAGSAQSQLVGETTIAQEMESMLAAINSGDLTSRLALEGKSGFVATLSRAVNQLADSTAQIVSRVKDATSEIHRGAEEIASGNHDLSQRTEEQASSLEETASSMEQMTSTVRQNAEHASQANQLAIAARDQAEKGGAVVGKAVHAMTGINEASRKIADIIGVIDEIAFQTNLLALNAAVEAARAGEQGRGFAVVATEVRGLAGRSATAAKEIKELIQDSVRKVEDGSVLVSESGQTLEQIVAAVKKVSDIIAEIAAASRDQSAGIEQVNRAVVQMDELTQQNAALVEQTTAASQSVSDQARELNGLMSRYRIEPRQQALRAREPVFRAVAPRAAASRLRRDPGGHSFGRPPGGKAARPATHPSATGRSPVRAAVAANGGDSEWQEL